MPYFEVQENKKRPYIDIEGIIIDIYYLRSG